MKVLRFFLALGFTVLTNNSLSQEAIAQEYEGCWMVNSAGMIVDLNGTVCLRSPVTPVLTPPIFSNLKVQPMPDGWVTVSGSVTNRNSQPIPLVLVEYKLVDLQSKEVLYKGIVPLVTTGTLQAGESVNFSRSLRANRLPQKPLTAITVQITRHL